MSREETMLTRFGEMMDMIACMAISNGADEKEKDLTFDEIFALR